MSPSASGLRVSAVSLNFTGDAKGPENCGSGVFIAAEFDGVGN